MKPKPFDGTAVPESPTPPEASVPLLAAALRRRLDHVTMVKRASRSVSLGTAALLIAVGAGAGLPAYANTLEAEQVVEHRPHPQSFTVSASAPLAEIVRDGYTVVVPPPLQYPLLTGTGITSGFGLRGGRMHEGADLFPGYGTPIYSMAAGVVIQASGAGDYGNHVAIEHVIDGQKVTSLYAHMAPGTMAVSVGDQVRVGQLLGGVGETGNAQGAHLHFEIHPGGGAAVDPYPWIAAHL